MHSFICNKCFAPMDRGKKPFCLTQCGHVYCHGCIQQEKQCPRCQQMDIFFVELQQPSLARVENFFAPLNESLESLHKTCAFQNTQTKILIERFHEIDKKYETLKSYYYNLTQTMKLMKEKYAKVKIENIELKKKLMSYKIQNRSSCSSRDSSMLLNSITQNSARMRINTPSSLGTQKGRNIIDGFCTPYPPSLKLSDTSKISGKNSSYRIRSIGINESINKHLYKKTLDISN